MPTSTSPSPRSKQRKLWWLALLAPLLLLFISGLANAGALLFDFTPTAYMYLPAVMRQNTFTPTPTPTPTITPTPTKTFTPTQTPSGGGSENVSGQLTLKLPDKPTYAAQCEEVWFYELIHNDDSSRSVQWGILGVNVTGPRSTNFFHTSWSAPDQPNQLFMLSPNCYGPVGMPCGWSMDGAKHLDAVGGYRSDGRLMYPGTYQLQMAICLSPYNVCPTAGAKWKVLSSVSIAVVDWYDKDLCPVTPVPKVMAGPTPTLAPQPLAGCHLDTQDPEHIRLICPADSLR